MFAKTSKIYLAVASITDGSVENDKENLYGL